MALFADVTNCMHDRPGQAPLLAEPANGPVAQPPVLSKLPTINPSASNAAEGGNQNVMHPTAGPSILHYARTPSMPQYVVLARRIIKRQVVAAKIRYTSHEYGVIFLHTRSVCILFTHTALVSPWCIYL